MLNEMEGARLITCCSATVHVNKVILRMAMENKRQNYYFACPVYMACTRGACTT